jgi:hypothetical protein
LSRSQAAYLVLARIDAYVKQEQVIYTERERTNINTMFALPDGWDEEHRLGWATGQYRKYVRAMDAVAAQNHVLAAHFIQPAPAIGKPLTEEEKAVVGDLGYRARYERMTGDVLALAKEGSPIFSLLDLFDHNTQTLYADVIHLRQEPDGASEGYRLMAERMASVLARTSASSARETTLLREPCPQPTCRVYSSSVYWVSRIKMSAPLRNSTIFARSAAA